MEPVLATARQVVEKNGLSRPQAIYVDEGILGSPLADSDWLDVNAKSDSRRVLGIQLADYVAYHCGYLLRCEVSGLRKPVTLDEMPHPLSWRDR